VVVLALRGFSEDKCALRASALTFLTLLSIVPIFALVFAVAKGFSLESKLETQLTNVFSENEAILNKILEFSRNQLQLTNGGVVAGLGVVLLLLTVLKLLGNIEKAFNEIWGVRKPRSFGRKLADYLLIMFIAPLFLVISGSLTAFLSAQPGILIAKYEFLRFIGPVLMFSIKLFPFFLLWALFSFIYAFIPNTKVRIAPMLVAGFAAAVIFHFAQWFYFYLQVKLFVKYSAIYGSLATFPLFLTWLEISWMIMLLGAEIAFASQNADTYEFEQDSRKASPRFRRLTALYILDFIVERFKKGCVPPSEDEIIGSLEVPARLARLVLYDLESAGVVSRVVLEDGASVRYQPGMPLEKITAQRVSVLLDALGVADIPLKRTHSLHVLESALKRIEKASEKSKGNILLGGD
jgi:membrane protein